MVLLRRVIGGALRGRRQAQHRTLREVSTAANVSLGYLSEIERGQKEASSELLSSICDALGAQLSEVLREASDTLAVEERMEGVLVPVGEPARAESGGTGPAAADPTRVAMPDPARTGGAGSQAADPETPPDSRVAAVVDGQVSIAVHHEGPLRTTLRATRAPGREVVRAA